MARLNIGGKVAQAAAIVAAVVTHQRPDLVAVPDQPLGQVTADEPPCPRHQDLPAHRRATPSSRLATLSPSLDSQAGILHNFRDICHASTRFDL